MTERERELASWRAYLASRTYREAGRMLGVHADTIRRHIALLRTEYGVKTNAQLAVALERERVA